MNSRERYLATMQGATPDHVPYFEEGIRAEVYEAWRRKGFPPEVFSNAKFSTDLREEIELDLDPHPRPRRWPTSRADLRDFARRLDPDDPRRLPANWRELRLRWKNRDHVLMFRVHDGFFLTMGVGDWQRFHELMSLVHDDPGFVREAMEGQGEFAARLTERALEEVEIDSAIFNEPIGANHGPLISPRMYADLILPSYRPVLEVLRRHHVEVVILRTYANARALIPALLKSGLDCLWACEVNTQAMDYRSLRQEYGRDLRLIGGIDLDVLRQDFKTMREEVEQKVPPLLEQGAYVPLADGRVRKDIPPQNYLYYRKLLQKITQPDQSPLALSDV